MSSNRELDNNIFLVNFSYINAIEIECSSIDS